ncbi:hypothetical protein SLEP1_g50271 [Rubroshorea leprosula]|uniref:Uncharacterized protein n=1 Tax=Rubroshorea leprosula TaxID=152421 RepID=A0AAV5M090_9ROSI|nr:hypothetical protein SLEP1_g50271 [Rubroshorea leprosula]
MKGRNCRAHWGRFTRSLRGWVLVDALFCGGAGDYLPMETEEVSLGVNGS